MKIQEILKTLVRESLDKMLNEERYNDLFDFLNQNIGKMTVGTVYYVSSMDSSMNKNLITPEGKIPNPMYGKLFKHTRYIFGWKDTYKRATERKSPEHVMGQRSGEYEKVEGYDMLEKKGDKLYLPIIPTGSEYKLYVMDGGEMQEISKEDAKQYLPQRKPYESASGVDFRLLIVNNIVKLTGGGNQWVNPDFSGKWGGMGAI